MTPQEKQELRTLRDEIEAPEDKRLIRKALNYITALEQKLLTIQILARTISREANPNNVRSEGDE